MNAADTLAEILQRAQKLSPDLFERRNDELIRGGLPGRSISQGRGGADSGPRFKTDDGALLDLTDVLALERRDEYRRNLTNALTLLARCGVLESPLMPERYLSVVELSQLHKRMAREAVEEVSSRAGECSNCKRAVERTPRDRLRAGRCFNCYRYRLDNNGKERPPHLWEREVTA